MRIIISSDTYYPNRNGCSYFTQRLAYYLQKRGHKILVIAPSKNRHQGFYSHNGIRVFGVRSLPILLYKNFRISPPLIIRRSLRKVIKEFNPHVIHVQGNFFISSAVLSIAKKMGIPVVGTNHFVPDNLTPYLHLPDKIDNIIHKLVWLHFCSVFNKLNFATTPTKSASEVLKKIGFKKEVVPVSNGIDLNVFNPQNDSAYLKKRYSIPDGKILLYVGRLDKEKNIDWIVKALKIAHKKVSLHFVIVGGGAKKEHLKHLVQTLGLENSVTFTGVVADCDLPKIYTLADCFVMAGTAELQCLSAMEAMASGLPIIVANSLALPELIEDGKNGYIFTPGNIEDLADKIVKVFTNESLRKEMGKRSLELIQKHDINESIGKFEKIYQSFQKED